MRATPTPEPWRFPPRAIAVRLFLTCWMIYSLHLATNIVREYYLAFSIGDALSFRVDEYANMHDDIFEKKGYGWHIGSNPGASMVAAIPYALWRPLTGRIVARVQEGRASAAGPPAYHAPKEVDRKFFEEAWKRGLDIKLGLGAFVMQVFCMAPSSALGVVAMFHLLRWIFGSDRTALWLALLYAVGTPVFFRTGTLNHNLMLGHIALGGFLAAWNPSGSPRWSDRARSAISGLAGGAALLFDYSGAVLLLSLLVYRIVQRRMTHSWRDAVRQACWYLLGAAGPAGLLWFYQWRSFGHPFFPGQHWMPPVEWIEEGYRGFSLPEPELLVALLFDYRYGLFVSCPLFALALLSLLRFRKSAGSLPRLELAFLLTTSFALWMFFGGVHYTRWQFNTGVRYLAPAFPLLFVPAALVLMSLPRAVIGLAGILSVAQAWSMAIFREVAAGKVELNDPDRGLGVLYPMLNVLMGGFQLPALTTLSRMEGFSRELGGVSPLPLFALCAVLVAIVWRRE